MMQIKDLQFKIKTATFEGDLDADGTILWSFEIEAAPKKCLDEIWEPRVYAETIPLKIKTIKGLEGKTIRVPKAYDDELGEHFFAIYVFEHEDVSKNQISFKKRVGSTFTVEWKAKCNVFFSEDYRKNLDLKIDTELKFKGIAFQGSSVDEAREALSKSLDLDEFVIKKKGATITFMLKD